MDTLQFRFSLNVLTEILQCKCVEEVHMKKDIMYYNNNNDNNDNKEIIISYYSG
jgi:hypothetical protein